MKKFFLVTLMVVMVTGISLADASLLSKSNSHPIVGPGQVKTVAQDSKPAVPRNRTCEGNLVYENDATPVTWTGPGGETSLADDLTVAVSGGCNLLCYGPNKKEAPYQSCNPFSDRSYPVNPTLEVPMGIHAALHTSYLPRPADDL